MTDFNLSEVISIYTRDCGELVEDIPVENSGEFLDSLTDALAVTPERLAEEENFNGAIYLLNSYEELDGKSAGGLLDLIVSGLKYETQQTQGAIDSNDVDSLPMVKGLLERYAFLLHWYLNSLERITLSKADAVVSTGKGSRTKVSGEFSAACQLVLSALEAICSCLRLNLSTIFVTSSEKDLFTSLFLKPVYQMMEHDQVVKNSKIRMHMFKVICLCVKMHSQQSSVQTSLMQLLIYFEHLPEPLAELLQILHEQFDHVAITEDMLKELSNREFNSNDTKGPKLVSQFLTRMAQLVPQVLMKQMSVLVKLLDIESFTLRCSVIEATGSIITYISQQEEDPERQKAQMHSFLDLIEERTLDVNPYCRCRAVQALTNVCELESKLTSRRPNFTAIAVRCLTDKSSLVRRNGIKLLSRLISTHPFDLLHGPQLDLKSWNTRLEQLETELYELQPDAGETTATQADESAIDGNVLDAPSDDEQEGEGANRTMSKETEEDLAQQQQKEENINRLKLTKKYYLEAIEFIHKVQEALGSAELLLFSNNKNEIIDSMDLFVLADAFGIEIARVGIRKMIHLIWAKANNDEGSAIQSHLISCYQSLFFDTPIGLPESDANLLVARNLISLTYSATLAELASLEKLLVLAMEKERLISNGVIKMLWKIYGYQQREISKSQRRGAIIILGMLSKADSSIANAGLELLLKIGLGEKGRKDLGLAKYTCIVLQHCVQECDWKKMRPDGVGPPRFAPSHEVIEGLCAFLLLPYQSMEWFGVAEQAIRAINDLCESPDLVYSKLIKIKTQEAFEGDGNEGALSQLLFIVGDVALKIMVHLERCEALFKRSKIALEKSNAAKRSEEENSKKEEDDDLEMVGGGTSEDDFTEAITYIREREMLYGKDSLLARFGNLVSDICKTGLQTPYAEHISVSSTLCLAKLMCVSSIYCEENLGVVMTLLERSNNSIIRSNCVLALGDVAVCFNHILDDNTDFLYRRLHDKYSAVQRTCLMTLTFLILAGQVKVKGQLGEMAKCLEDPDKRIADLARMFFTELATKDNAIYNGFIDMFSVLSADPQLSEDSLHKILKFLASFIDKDKQIKQLADKFHGRLARCPDQKSWNDIAYVLGLLPHKNEDISKTLSEGFKYVSVAE